MRLRLRNKDQVHIITSLNEKSKMIELRQEIQRINGVSPAYQELKTGFPPKVCGANDEVTLESAGIQNGDLILLTDLTPPPTAAAAITNRNLNSSKITATGDDSTTMSKDAVISSPVENGYAVLREMADDNSCLFRAIEDFCYKKKFFFKKIKKIKSIFKNNKSYVLENSSEVAQKLRQNPVTYSDIILGKSRNEYCKWIAQKNSWGGAIEIRSVDVGTGRIDKYGEGNYDQCVYIVYSGIHYDAVALTPMISADKDYDQTIFEISDQSILNGAISIANKMKKLHKYTYTANFTLRCGQCEKGLVGDKEAVQHAKDTVFVYFHENRKLLKSYYHKPEDNPGSVIPAKPMDILKEAVQSNG
ncbi:17089_t:CDS:10 [Entrophospora sp. SA101]|nr:17089_t:CDS:10 [Entrophospora sp. SA101]